MSDQKIALVTGASRGIGRATALRLAREGYHVVLTARTEAGLVETEEQIFAEGGTATIAPLDLTKGEEVDKLAAAISSRWNRLDLLVLNAGTLGSLTPVAHATPKEFDSVMALNVTAQWRLIRNFDAQLRIARGTVIAVTSSVAQRIQAYWGPYSASKAALENLVSVYAAEMQTLGVNAMIVDPGRTRTDMRAQAFPGEDPNSVKTPDTVANAIADALPQLQAGLSRLKVAPDGTSELTRG